MEIFAVYKNARVSPQKCRLIGNQIRGLNVEKAINILSFSPKKASVLVMKALNSAIANAENNENIDVDDLYVSQLFIDSGMKLKRMRARAKGRGNRIIKKTSHITIAVKVIEE